MVYRRRGSRHFYVAVPTRTGWVKRSTGTADRPTARDMADMLRVLAHQRKWDLLEAVAGGRLELGALYDAWRMNDLDGLKARLDEVNLEPDVARWHAWLTDRVHPTTADRYLAHVRTLLPEGRPFPRSGFTAPALAAWLADRRALVAKRKASTKGSRRREDPPPRALSGSSRRKYLAAVQSYVGYLREVGILESNPAADLTAPRAAPPRCDFLELPDVLRVVEGALPPFRAIFSLAYGAGVEISAILALVDADVDCRRREVRARACRSSSSPGSSATRTL